MKKSKINLTIQINYLIADDEEIENKSDELDKLFDADDEEIDSDKLFADVEDEDSD